MSTRFSRISCSPTIFPVFLNYITVCGLLSTPGAQLFWNEERKVPHVVVGDQWIGYDNVTSLTEKVNWMMNQGYGGWMVWAIDLDDFSGSFCNQGPYPLLTAMKRLLEGENMDTAAQFEPSVDVQPAPMTTTTPTNPGVLQVDIPSSWSTGFSGNIHLVPDVPIVDGWTITLIFQTPVESIDVWTADVVSVSADGLVYELADMGWNADLEAGEDLDIAFNGNILAGAQAPSSAQAYFGSTGPGPVGPAATEAPPTAPQEDSTPSASEESAETDQESSGYDYESALHKSILFYEAQRSGALPANNRIPWRGDSALSDQGDNGEDLTGGWYDAGDNVKFNFPQAFAVTTLTWGLLEYWDAYEAAGELQYMLDSIKWPLDYFIKCHTAENELYGQVGNGGIDHSYWGRAEEMTMPRPAYKLDASHPGSDLAAEMAAAMAAGAMAFRNINASYSAELLGHAKQVYDFAYNYRGKYSDSITDATDYYKSWSGYEDELGWGALWLYAATGQEQHYLDKAEQFPPTWNQGLFSWDDKRAGYLVMHCALTEADSSCGGLEDFVDYWLEDVQYTAGGLAYGGQQWGTCRYAANAAFIALLAADIGVRPSLGRTFARSQIDYMLGDYGHSLVVGFGDNPPVEPHHAGASCPDLPASCGWDEFYSWEPNPQVLQGALVGGPDVNDNYDDNRQDYVFNEVAVDYNAGFQSALAGLLALDLD